MRKHFVLLTGIACALLSVSAFAAEAEADGKEILFRGIPWHSTKAEVEEALFAEGGSEGGWMSTTDSIYRLSGIDYVSTTSSSDRVDGGGYKGWYSGIDVAGYTPSDTYACYVYPIEDGRIVDSVDDAEFYFGWYTFSKTDFQDYQAIYDDLSKKLSSLYGDGEAEESKYRTTLSWKDADENQIRLLINADKTYVTLGYIAGDADTLLDNAQAALDAAASAAEESERLANENNTSGL